MKILITENQLEKVIKNYISRCFSGTEQKTTEKSFGSSIFLVKKGMVLAELQYSESHNGWDFYVHNEIWHDIKDVFHIKHLDLWEIMNSWAEKYFKKTNIDSSAISMHPRFRWKHMFKPD